MLVVRTPHAVGEGSPVSLLVVGLRRGAGVRVGQWEFQQFLVAHRLRTVGFAVAFLRAGGFHLVGGHGWRRGLVLVAPTTPDLCADAPVRAVLAPVALLRILVDADPLL